MLQNHTLDHVSPLRLNGWKTAAERRPAAPSSSLTNKAQQIITVPIYTLGTNQRRTNVKYEGLHLLYTELCHCTQEVHDKKGRAGWGSPGYQQIRRHNMAKLSGTSKAAFM